ncbi:serine/threonine protein kinase [Mucilaginibacter glaciei]|uniref:Serine/threonine protein kinase n=1 Tax=Mucilaginibacter glaciei TaxID=2772109 RepID=A0A926RZ64_9SPHI|nr:serine/threonine-protein kinase [Mucilaginibacter glaciei]MBD1391540.1 serine/threonine protein kinase [Mucilaginibacter glaciei]
MSKVFTITEGLENLGALRTGGQGSVYKGRRMGPILTAVKLLPTPIYTESDEDKNYRNFKNEVAKLQKVNEVANPNVVKFLSSGITESGSLPYIEMEYIEGPDLCELLQPPHEKIFMLQEVIRVAYQLANALAHCHQVGIKHGDIKSNNVKYNVQTGNYVLLDFGLAIMSEEQRRTSIRNAGAIEFMAPEQQEGEMLLQTDVYSYGIVMYELLTGCVPFPLQGNNETGRNTVMIAHLETPVPDLVTARRAALPQSWDDAKQAVELHVPQWLLQVVSKCLEKKPGDRFNSAVELKEAIVSGSLSGDKQGQQSILLTENERLKDELAQLQQSDGEKDKLIRSVESIAIAAGATYNKAEGRYEQNRTLKVVPKNVFTGVVVAAVFFMALAVYAFVTKAPNVIDNRPIYTSGKGYLHPPYIAMPYTQDNLAVDAITAAEIKRVAAKRRRVVADSIAAAKARANPVKRKRKKFLGIF